ncbi:GtrA family protein [uncultured Mucilaginibacter sp.]|uniref:GtrA family protein n=1 Tax=uncultured Mucilaginibacter sp. TaxID=797541 RepID=UPI0025D282F5|nr:GtrA family protein [uncultured Mucilaginibacter sp.]
MTETAAPASGRKTLLKEVLRFILSAGIGFVVDVAAYYILYHNLLQQKSYDIWGYTVKNSTLSLAISFFLGVLVNFVITKFFVFSKSESSPSKQFLRFIAVAIVGFYANLGMLKVMINYCHLDPPVARPAAALSLFFASFFVHKFFSFSLSLRHHAPTRHRAASN